MKVSADEVLEVLAEVFRSNDPNEMENLRRRDRPRS